MSLVQSTLVNVLALWVMRVDKERSGMTSGERVYGYTGAGGLVQAVAAGYFLWDLMISTVHFKIFGPGLWFHAVSALWVFSFGFVSACFFVFLPSLCLGPFLLGKCATQTSIHESGYILTLDITFRGRS